jgi:DHA1 family multidrug resistance protein-like MFS transporter
MESWRRNLVLLWIGALLTSASFSMVIPFLPLFLVEDLGVHTWVNLWSGLLFSAAFITGALISPYWGSLADKYGRKPMILRSGFSLFAVYFLTAFVHHPYQLLLLRMLQGLLSGYIPGAIALVGTNTPERHVGMALAWMSTATATGNILGPLMGGALATVFGHRAAFASASVIVLMATFIVWFWVTEDRFQPKTVRSSVWGDLREAAANPALVRVLALTALTAFSIMTIEPILPLYIARIRGTVANASLAAGMVFSLAGIASILFAPRWGRWADKIGFQKVLWMGLIGGGIGNFAQMAFHNLWGFAATRFLYGAFFCAVFPALNGLVVRSTSPDFRGRAFSLNQSANQIGTLFGPLAGGLIAQVAPARAVFAVTGLLLLLTAGVSWWTSVRKMTKRSTAESRARSPVQG